MTETDIFRKELVVILLGTKKNQETKFCFSGAYMATNVWIIKHKVVRI